MLVYKICTADEWADAVERGRFEGSPVDLEDGFIHLSSGAQVRDTAERHFAGRDGLVLVAVESDVLGEALRWEPSRGGDDFPHLYGPLRVQDTTWVQPLPLGADGTHRFHDLV